MSAHDLLELLIHAVLAIFGVSARELRYKDERRFKIARLISDAIIASFGATIVFFASSMSGLPPQMGYIMAGLVGWGGPQIIDKLFEKNVDIAKGDDTDAKNCKPAETDEHDKTEAGEE
jgi:hypothetical protein